MHKTSLCVCIALSSMPAFLAIMYQLQSLNCFPRCFDLINLGESPRNWTLAQNAVLQSMANLPSSTFTAHPIFYTKPIICRDVK